jgi:POT family proton-dependent oligopeptide transporter
MDVTVNTFFGHPRGLATLFFTEMWERFSYYGMRALLILFMTARVEDGGLGFDVARAAAIYGTYTAVVYLLSLPGGMLADRFLGLRRAVLLGGIIIMAGHICLAVPTLTSFYAGLVCIVIGTGLLKPNVSAMVGQLYDDEVRRDAGYSIYYMGVNLGGFLAPLLTGYLAQGAGFRAFLSRHGIAPETSWHWGFGLAALGMFLGLVQYVAGGRHLDRVGRVPLRGGEAALDHSRECRWGGARRAPPERVSHSGHRRIDRQHLRRPDLRRRDRLLPLDLPRRAMDPG